MPNKYVSLILSVLTDNIKRGLLWFRYDSWTIAEYYRKQGARVGDNCRIDIRSNLYDAELVSIGNHVFIAQGVKLHTHDGGAWMIREEIPNIRITGPIVIEDNCVIGADSHLFLNVRIGANSIVGAGSVVISNIPPNSIVMGVPARVMGSTIKYREKHIEAWNEQVKSGKQALPDLKKDERYYRL